MVTKNLLTILTILLFLAIPFSQATELDNSYEEITIIKENNFPKGLLSKVSPIQNSQLNINSQEVNSILFHQITDVDAYGTDLVNNYRRQIDTMTVNLYAKIDDDCDISAEQVLIGADTFSSCTNSSNCAFLCTYTGIQDPLLPKKHYLNIRLKDDSGVEVYSDSNAGYISVDNIGPVVTSFSTDKSTLSGNQNLSLSFAVTDYAYSTTGSSDCAGMKKIDMYVNNAVKESFLPSGSKSCSLSSVILSFSGVPNSAAITILLANVINIIIKINNFLPIIPITSSSCSTTS